MKKLVLALTVVLVLSGIFAVAALTQVEIDRDVDVTVASDIDPDVAVRFEVLGDYETMFPLDDNQVKFDLSDALNHETETTGSSYNTHATFRIGSQSQRVFRITNQTGINIYVYTTLNAESTEVLQLRDQNGSLAPAGGWMLTPGGVEEFYFELNTVGDVGAIVAKLVISESAQE